MSLPTGLTVMFFKTFLQRLIYQFGKLVIVIDQGPYHISGDMQKFYFEYKKHLHVVYFPSYSSELDPIEQSWRAAKKWLAIRYRENKSELRQQLITAFKEGYNYGSNLRLFKNLAI
jgi:transposase